MGHKDLLVEAAALRDALVALECAPLRTPKSPGLHDAWKRLVAPRAARGRAVLDALLKPVSWTFDDADRATTATSNAWALVRRELPRLHAAMGGALAGLLHAVPHATGSTLRLRLGRVAAFGPGDKPKTLRARQAEAFERLAERRDASDRERLHVLAKGLRTLQKRLRRVLTHSHALLVALLRSEQRRLADRAGDDAAAEVARALVALRRARLDLDAHAGRPTSALALRFEHWWVARESVLDALVGRGTVERPARRRGRPPAKETAPPDDRTATQAPELDDLLPPETPPATLEIVPSGVEGADLRTF